MTSDDRVPAEETAEETAEEWWARNEPEWKRNPGYHAHLADKADRFGKEWVRRHKGNLDAYARSAAGFCAAQAWIDEHGLLEDW